MDASRNQTLPSYRIGDLIWCRWSSIQWPAMIAYDPHQAVYYRTSNHKITQYHVQYFGIVAQRGWVPAKGVVAMKNIDEYKTTKQLRKKLQEDFDVAMGEATQAIKLSLKQRKLKFIFNYNSEDQDNKPKRRSVSKKQLLKVTIKRKMLEPREDSLLHQSVEPLVTNERECDLASDQVRLEPDNNIEASTTTSRPTSRYSLRSSLLPKLKVTIKSEPFTDMDSGSTDMSRDIFPSPCSQNLALLTPPSTGSETDSMDIDIHHQPSTSNKDLLVPLLEPETHTIKQEIKKVKPKRSLTSSLTHHGICSICDNPGSIITCSGHCFQSFHLDCLGLIKCPRLGFVCDECVLTPTVCFICKETKKDESLIACSQPQCDKQYHSSCFTSLKMFQFKEDTRKLICGLHVCAKCTCTEQLVGCGQKLIQCIQCPLALHKTSCLIAGCEVLDDNRMVCYLHLHLSSSLPQSMRHFNMNSCLDCGDVGSLVCCDMCSAAYHVKCLSEEHQDGCDTDRWLCPCCSDYDLPTYESVVMVKCGAYKWWPAEIVSSKSIPDSLLSSKPTRCMFLVRFFASSQYFWTHHGRVIAFTEECAVIRDDKKYRSNPAAKQSQALYTQAFQEALDTFHKRRQKLEELKSTKKESKSFVHIKRNKYIVPRPPIEIETEQCRCTPDNPCTSTSNCINRAVYIECSKNCPVSNKCQNQRIHLGQNAPTVPFHTGGRGWGLKGKSDLKPGDFVVEYIGEVVNMTMVQERLKKAQEASVTSFYFLTLGRDLIIDASDKSNHARFINHSCDPNCETQKWTVNGETRIGIFAIKDIPAGTELTFDYRLDSLGNEKKKCLCGSANCSGYLGERPKQNRDKDKEKTNARGMKRRRHSTKCSKLKVPKIEEEEEVCEEPALKFNHRKQPEETDAVVEKSKRKRQHFVKKEYNTKSRKKDDDPYDDECYVCQEGGELVLCDYQDCSKVYHLTCAGLDSLPEGEFYCPRHWCQVCKNEAVYQCFSCPTSFCHDHFSGRIMVTDAASFRCKDKCWPKITKC